VQHPPVQPAAAFINVYAGGPRVIEEPFEPEHRTEEDTSVKRGRAKPLDGRHDAEGGRKREKAMIERITPERIISHSLDLPPLNAKC
jgi:hypothetical protein